jgi:hypothetical protein
MKFTFFLLVVFIGLFIPGTNSLKAIPFDSVRVIVLDEKIGDTLDLKERNYYRLFGRTKNFQSAVFLKLTREQKYLMQITKQYVKSGEKRRSTYPLERNILMKLRDYIQYFDKLVPAARNKLFTSRDSAILGLIQTTKPQKEPLQRRHANLEEVHVSDTMIWQLEEQARLRAQEHWGRDRWREEILNDHGMNYKLSGGILGSYLGAATGMLIGKTFQGQEVRQEIHKKSLCIDFSSCAFILTSSWKENIYSYEHKYAPHWGAIIGAGVGALTGYLSGRYADKKYYCLVPETIRMQNIESTWDSYLIWGAAITGPIMGIITENTLSTPKSIKEGERYFNYMLFTAGYLA